MSFSVNVPPSQLAKLTKAAEEEGEGDNEEVQAKKREDWRKLKELEEARKAGTAPAMQDEEGRDINPHIPQYIMQAPWYFGAVKPTLNHQRIQDDTVKEYTGMSEWYKRGVREGPVATKYKKGACENCGATTHKKKDCLEVCLVVRFYRSSFIGFVDRGREKLERNSPESTSRPMSMFSPTWISISMANGIDGMDTTRQSTSTLWKTSRSWMRPNGC